MIIETIKLKEICSKILSAVDSSELSVITETLQIKAENNKLFLEVTNGEYFARINLDLAASENFHATVNANLFLKLISQVTTSDIELNVTDKNLNVKANGTYKLPLIFDNDKLLELPEIRINNITKTLTINSSILNSILTYNSKELTRGTISKPVQKLYYMDNEGAITFTTGACVNEFTLSEPLRVLLTSRVVKLFKLFHDCDVKVNLGFDEVSDTITQTKMSFISDLIEITAILPSTDSMLNSVPVSAIRGMANDIYDYSIVMNKDALLQTINRLLLFNTIGKESVKPYSTFEFKNNYVTVWDIDKQNSEDITYISPSMLSNEYTAVLDLIDLKAVLETSSDQYVTLNFGNKRSFVIIKGKIKNIIPEVASVNG